MPRFSTTKDTPIEFRKRRPQTGTRYRESGLVLRLTEVIDCICGITVQCNQKLLSILE
jgi:hypothetical protein